MKINKKLLIPAAALLAAGGIGIAALTGGSPKGLPDEIYDSTVSGIRDSGITVTAYQSPVDFESLRDVNGDIYAWLDVPGADISYPVVQSSYDDSYYLDHTSEKEYSYQGALFTEHMYNTKSFDDPVTIIYGHNLLNGRFFGNMQSFYSSADNFRSSDEMMIYLPEKELTYKLFATVIFDNRHILYTTDFTDENAFRYFFSAVSASKDLGNNIDRESFPEYGDRVLILSTCLNGDRSRRFLVMGKLISESDHFIINNKEQ